MANPRVLVKRRKAVRNIRKITRTMQLIATARFQQALTQATASRPYAEKITEFAQELGASGEQVRHPLLTAHPESGRSILLVITSNRGLCGGYNSALLRTAEETLRAAAEAGRTVELHALGKKGVGYYRFLKRPLAQAVTNFPDTPKFAHVEPLAEGFMRQYATGQYAGVQVVYQRFLSVARQAATCVQLLPVQPDASPGAAHGEPPSGTRASAVSTAPTGAEQVGDGDSQYDFSPPPARLLEELLPVMVKARLFQCFMDATVSEQVARMVAMKAATDAADEMIKLLTRQYNRSRQTQITSELLDIIGGAEALK